MLTCDHQFRVTGDQAGTQFRDDLAVHLTPGVIGAELQSGYQMKIQVNRGGPGNGTCVNKHSGHFVLLQYCGVIVSHSACFAKDAHCDHLLALVVCGLRDSLNDGSEMVMGCARLDQVLYMFHGYPDGSEESLFPER